MANNRLYLVHKPSGRYAYLGKRMATGWYSNQSAQEIGEAVIALFDGIEHEDGSQDDFILAIEDASSAPRCTDHYEYNRDKNRIIVKDDAAL